jgi:hypothetical protein
MQEKEKRQVVVNMKMSERERDIIVQLARRNGESVAGLLRRLALSEARKVEVQK